MTGLGSRALMFVLSAYRRYVSPLLPPSCRFFPSCSAYTLEAVSHHGCLKGLWLGLRRLLRCHPLREGGIDPVPR
ncbi:MAG: membrane protein insertion efficiency factor YidD [Deltaproteobacteria bacterium]|nr:membrane protein insertion efficiency factor YidD [Deltaproteobacteria bacterium]